MAIMRLRYDNNSYKYTVDLCWGKKDDEEDIAHTRAWASRGCVGSVATPQQSSVVGFLAVLLVGQCGQCGPKFGEAFEQMHFHSQLY